MEAPEDITYWRSYMLDMVAVTRPVAPLACRRYLSIESDEDLLYYRGYLGRI